MHARHTTATRAVLALLCLAPLGCDDDDTTNDPGCDVFGERVAVGTTVDDPLTGVRCACTPAGARCSDPPDSGRARDGGPADAAPPGDAAPALDMGSVAGDAAVANDTGPAGDVGGAADAEATDRGVVEGDCPVSSPAGFQCRPREEGLSCPYGDPLDCCGQVFPEAERCTCTDGEWRCTSSYTACVEAEGPDCAERGRVCGIWNALNAEGIRGDGEWVGGDLASCMPGDMAGDWRPRALAQVNRWRQLAGLHTVRNDPRLDAQAQACAMALNARGSLTHNLTPGDRCYSPEAAEGARRSNIHTLPSILSLSDYIRDPSGPLDDRNFRTLTHRLWLLSTNLGDVGIGSTDRFSCLLVDSGRQNDEPAWVPWPPAGIFPFQAGLADDTGWSIHSNRVNLNRAEVTVTVDGEARPIQVRILEAAGGAGHGIAWVPDGWRSEPGVDYHVRVEDIISRQIEGPLEYTVRMIDCAP